MNYLQNYGKKLIDRGFKIAPIPEGYKWPKGFKGWEKYEATPEMVDQWVKQGVTGVAILCEHTPAVDLDIPDKSLSATIWNEVVKIAGEGPLRFGKKPKSLMPFKTLAPFHKKSSKKYQNPADPVWEDGTPKTYQVEILGTGNEFVAYANHPDTGKPYEWFAHLGELYDTPRSDLPTLDQYKADQIIAAFESKVPKEWVEISKSGKKKSLSSDLSPEVKRDLPSADAFANMKTKWGGTVDQIKKILEQIDAADYTMWVDVGFSLWHETDGSDTGFRLWDEWSQTAPEAYGETTEKEMRDKWKGFDWRPLAEEGRPFKTFKSVVFYAHDGETQDPKEVNQFLDRYFYINAGKKVFDSKQDNMEYACLDLDEFLETKKNVKVLRVVPAPTEKDPMRVKEKECYVAKLWQEHEHRKTCEYLDYMPGKGVINHVTGTRYQINTCRMPNFALTKDVDLSVFHEHMELLFPKEDERHWFVSWMARKIQNPADKCAVTPLLVAPEEGVGRSWVGEMLMILLGRLNCKRTEIKNLSSGNQFNSYLNDNLLCVIDEVYQRKGAHSEGKFEISANLKTKITEKYAEINVKFEPTRMKPIYTDFLLMTNERDALSFSDANRRIAVFLYEGMARDREYYERLYGWLEDEKAMAGLWWYLREYDISGVDFSRAPETAAKREMAEESKSPVEWAIDDIVEDGDFNATTPDLLLNFIRENHERFEGIEPFKLPSSVQIRKILQHRRHTERASESQVRLSGRGSKKYRVWFLDKRIDMSIEKVREDLIKQGAC